jgi:subtilisin family serine protease
MSLGVMKRLLSKTLVKAFDSAVAYAKNKGAVLVAAAGNENSRVENSYPAGIRDVISVGAIQPVTDQRASFSNFGKSLDFVAPGVDVLSLKANGVTFGLSSGNPDYVRASGTSMSSPIVAGTVALLRAWNPLLTFSDIYNRLKASAVDLGAAGFDQFYGFGLVDALGAFLVGSSSSLAGTAANSPSGEHGNKNRGQKGPSVTGYEIPLSSPGSPQFTGPVGIPLGWYTGSLSGHKKSVAGSLEVRKKNRRASV